MVQEFGNIVSYIVALISGYCGWKLCYSIQLFQHLWLLFNIIGKAYPGNWTVPLLTSNAWGFCSPTLGHQLYNVICGVAEGRRDDALDERE